jgi:hypothetical protein
MAPNNIRKLERSVILAVATLAFAFVTMVVSVATHHLSLPPSDLAYGGPWFPTPVLQVALFLSLITTLVAYPFMIWGLLQTQLVRSLPVVCSVAVISTSATAPFLGPWAIVPGIALLIVSMGFCRSRFRGSVSSSI